MRKKKNKKMDKLPVDVMIGEIDDKLLGIVNSYNELYKKYRMNNYMVLGEGTDYIPLKIKGKPIHILSKPKKEKKFFCSYCKTPLETDMGCCIYCGNIENKQMYDKDFIEEISEEIVM